MYGRCVTIMKIGPIINIACKRYSCFTLQLLHLLLLVHLLQDTKVSIQHTPQSIAIAASKESTIYGRSLSSMFLSLRTGVLSFKVTTAAISKANMYSISIPAVRAMLKTFDFEFLYISIRLVL